MLARARRQFAEGALDEALATCAELLDAGVETAELHLLLADIYQAQGRSDFAARARRRAASLLPEGVQTRDATARERAAGAELPEHSPWRVAVIAAGLGIAASGLFLAWQFPGRPVVAGISWVYVGIGGVGAWALALGLGAAGALGSFDDELAFGGLRAPGKTVVPNGVLLLVTGVMSPYAALAAFALICLFEGRLLRGTLVAFVVTFGWAAVLTMLADWHGFSGRPIIGWGLLNLVFVAVLLGWAIGYAFRARPWD